MAYRARIEGVDGLLREVLTARSKMGADLGDVMESLGDDAEVIYAAHALKRTGRMARGIKAHRAGSTVLVTAKAVNPETGYDYVAVTRFGHRAQIIFPKKGRALWTPWGYFAYVRGFRPKGDWAKRAWPEIKQLAGRAAKEVGFRVIAHFR